MKKKKYKQSLQLARHNARIELLEELALLQKNQNKSLIRCLNKLNKSILNYFKGDGK